MYRSDDVHSSTGVKVTVWQVNISGTKYHRWVEMNNALYSAQFTACRLSRVELYCIVCLCTVTAGL